MKKITYRFLFGPLCVLLVAVSGVVVTVVVVTVHLFVAVPHPYQPMCLHIALALQYNVLSTCFNHLKQRILLVTTGECTNNKILVCYLHEDVSSLGDKEALF